MINFVYVVKHADYMACEPTTDSIQQQSNTYNQKPFGSQLFPVN